MISSVFSISEHCFPSSASRSFSSWLKFAFRDFDANFFIWPVQNSDQEVFGNNSNISNTRDSVSIGKSKHREKRVENTTQWSIFREIRGVWIADEIMPRVFDISSQPNQKLRSKRRSEIVKIYPNNCYRS